MTDTNAVKTQAQLMAEHGEEDYTEAMRILSQWSLDNELPTSVQQIRALRELSELSYHIYGAILIEKVNAAIHQPAPAEAETEDGTGAEAT